MIIGAIAQWILGQTKRGGGVDWAMALIAGLVGSFVGGLLFSLIAGDGLKFRPSGIIGSLIGYWVSAWLNDRIGRRITFILYACASAATVIVYTQLPIDNTMMLYLGFPLGFFASGIFSGMGPFLTELFPTRMRGSGQGFAYNFGRGVGALFPMLVGTLSASMPMGRAIAIFAIGAYALLFIAALALPETKGKTLHADG